MDTSTQTAMAQTTGETSLSSVAVRRSRTRFVIQMAPVLILYAVFLIVPYAYLVETSFLKYDWMYLIVEEFTLENYWRIFSDPFYLRIIAQTLALSLCITLITLAIGYPTAWVISRASPRMRSLLLAAVLSPLLVNLVIRTYAWQVLLNDLGLINQWLIAIGWISDPLPLGRNLFAVIVGLVHITLPFMVLSLLSVIDNLDKEMLEIADSLGSSSFRTFKEVILPLTLPGIAAGSVLVFCYSNSAFVTPQVLGGGEVSTVATIVFSQFSYAMNLPFGSAMVMVLLAITLPFIALQHYLMPAYTADKQR